MGGVASYSTFIGIGIHNLSSGGGVEDGTAVDLAAAVRQAASGILGTTVQLADLVSSIRVHHSYAHSYSHSYAVLLYTLAGCRHAQAP